jgi:hypothetical protein
MLGPPEVRPRSRDYRRNEDKIIAAIDRDRVDRWPVFKRRTICLLDLKSKRSTRPS